MTLLDPAYQPDPFDVSRPPVTSPQVIAVGRDFARSGEVVRLHTINGLAALSRWRRGEDAAVEAWLDRWQARGVTAIRVASTLAGSWWNGEAFPAEDLTLAPGQAGYLEALLALVAACEARGLVVVLTLLGPGVTRTTGCAIYDEREGHIRWVVGALADAHSVLYEVAYQPRSEGLDSHEVLAHVQTVRRLDETALVAYGAEVGVASWGMSSPRGGQWLSAHPDRGSAMTVDPWGWLVGLASGVYQPARVATPVVQLQSMTFGEGAGYAPDDVEADPQQSPARAWAYGVLGALLGWETAFSSITSMRVTEETAFEQACADEWLTGAGRVRLDAGYTQTWRMTPTRGRQASPFAAIGEARLIVGRDDGETGEALVLEAAANWQPLTQPGWTATVEREVGGARLVRVARR